MSTSRSEHSCPVSLQGQSSSMVGKKEQDLITLHLSDQRMCISVKKRSSFCLVEILNSGKSMGRRPMWTYGRVTGVFFSSSVISGVVAYTEK